MKKMIKNITSRIIKGILFMLLAVINIFVLSAPAYTDTNIQDDRLKLYGDVRLRLESDWDSTKSDGTERDDRDRMRGRLRFGFDYKYSDIVLFGARLRTGSPESQQSPHVTLGDDSKPKKFNIDKLYIRTNIANVQVWGGKNSFPFWKQNELFWDNDVTPEGVAVSYWLKLGSSSRLDINTGAFILSDSGASNRFNKKTSLLAGQAVGTWKLSGVGITASAGYFDFNDNPAEDNPALLNLDYRIWVLSFKSVIKNLPKPLILGIDYMKNTANYSTSMFNRNETTGYVFSVKYGGLKNKGDWLLGYYYAHIEKYAVVPYFAQDDWLRWGSSAQTKSSNFKGHEFRAAYAFGAKFNLVARLYLVNGITPESASVNSKEDGNRFRLDLNIGF